MPVHPPIRRRITHALILVMAVLLTASSLFTVTGAPASATALAPEGLRVNGLEQPADLDTATAPAFSWYVTSEQQTAYRVVVATTAAAAAAGTGDIWDSGQVDSTAQTGIDYAGSALEAGTRYHWSVQTWDQDGAASAWAPAAWFGTSPGSTWESGTPIWSDRALPGAQPAWDDYTVTTRFTITQTALGIFFRAPDTNSGLMWQFRADSNTIVPHTIRSGQYTALPAITLPANTIVANQPTSVELAIANGNIVTRVGGIDVDTRAIDPAVVPAVGGVGFRTGRTEAGYVHEIAVRNTAGDVLLDNDFGSTNPFPCGSISNGAYNVGNSQACVFNAGVISTDWSFLRTEVTPQNKEIAGATLFATAGDFRAHLQYAYKAYINGSFVGLGPTNRIGNENRFDGFDVTELIQPGQPNAVAALAYTSGADRQRFIAELRIDYVDGTSEVFGSDETWKGLPGSLAYPAVGSIGTGYFSAPKENLDLRNYPTGFTSPGFDDSAWANAVAKPAFTALQATPMAKVTEEHEAPVQIIDKGNGNYFVDFGRTWIGGVSYDITNGQAGQKVDLRFGEVETAAGSQTVKYQLNTGNVYQDVVTLTDGTQTIDTWGMRVFRYLEIIGAPEPVTVDNLSALALMYPFDREASSFTSSDNNLNQVYQLSKNSIESLNVNFFTDSWTRERTNYEADGYLQQMSSLYLMEDLSLARYSMNYFAGNRTWPTEWPIYVVLSVHDAWRQTGDLDQVEQYYDNLTTKMPTRWIDQETGLVGKASRSDGCNSQTDCDIVDWPSSQRDGYQFRHYNTVVNALSYRAMQDMSAMAAALGKEADATMYADQATRLRASMNDLLYNAELGAYDDGMTAAKQTTGHYALHGSAFALAFGVPEAEETARVANFVADKGMVCSVYCAGFSISGLIDGGRADAAIAQMSAEGTSSWMNMIKRGAGSTAEAWDETQKNNLTYSHPWAASPAFHVPSGIFGIQPIEAGYSTFQVKPQPGSLAYASTTVPTVKGKIGVAFDHDADGLLQTIAQIPGNTTADISVPVPADTTRVFVNGKAESVTVVDGFATLSGVTAGCQLITLDSGASAVVNERLTSICAPALVPVAPDAEALTPDTEGRIDAPATAIRGKSINVAVPGLAGQDVRVWLFSEPSSLGTHTVSEDETVTVEIPADTELGAHRIAATLTNNELIGWDAITVQDEEDSGGENPGGETPGGETPGGETPGGETPGGETPGGETPGGETPGGETPGGETPGAETPGSETPGSETGKPGADTGALPTTGGIGLPMYGLLVAAGVMVAGAVLLLRRRTVESVAHGDTTGEDTDHSAFFKP